MTDKEVQTNRNLQDQLMGRVVQPGVLRLDMGSTLFNRLMQVSETPSLLNALMARWQGSQMATAEQPTIVYVQQPAVNLEDKTAVSPPTPQKRIVKPKKATANTPLPQSTSVKGEKHNHPDSPQAIQVVKPTATHYPARSKSERLQLTLPSPHHDKRPLAKDGQGANGRLQPKPTPTTVVKDSLPKPARSSDTVEKAVVQATPPTPLSSPTSPKSQQSLSKRRSTTSNPVEKNVSQATPVKSETAVPLMTTPSHKQLPNGAPTQNILEPQSQRNTTTVVKAETIKNREIKQTAVHTAHNDRAVVSVTPLAMPRINPQLLTANRMASQTESQGAKRQLKSPSASPRLPIVRASTPPAQHRTGRAELPLFSRATAVTPSANHAASRPAPLTSSRGPAPATAVIQRQVASNSDGVIQRQAVNALGGGETAVNNTEITDIVEEAQRQLLRQLAIESERRGANLWP